MSEQKYTLGPWHVVTVKEQDENANLNVGDIVDTRGECIAYTYGDREYDDTLIAAAPDMYEALVMVEREIGPEDRSTSRKVRAALARAGWSR